MLNAQGVQPTALEVNDFSGGMTDNFVGAGPQYYQKADNLNIGDDRKLVTRAGLTLADSARPRISTNKRINRTFDLLDQLFQVSNSKLYYNNAGFTHMMGPSGNNVFTSGGEFSYVSYTKWNKHVFLANSAYAPIMKVFKDGSTWKSHQVGLPALASTPTITGTAGPKKYIYKFHYYYQYTSQGVLFEEVGPVLDSPEVTYAEPSGGSPINISVIPSFTNSTATNFDSANMKIKIFRNINLGQTYFQVGEVPNGTLTFADTLTDTLLQVKTPIYITGDKPDHEAPPPAKFIHSVNDILWLGNIKDSDGQIYPNKLRLSNRFSLWSVPSAYEEEFDEEIKGISSVNIYPIVFCENKVYRLEGFYNPDGSGQIQKKLISSTAGCLSEASIVQTDAGVFWAGTSGYYFTDGSTVTRISELINVTYKALTEATNQRERITGTYNPTKQTVQWTMQEDVVSTDCDKVFNLHLKFGTSANMPFTTWSGGSNFRPTGLHMFKGDLYHADTNGYLLKYDDEVLTDARIDNLVAATGWRQQTIIYLLLDAAHDFGTSALRKWVPLVVVYAENASSISMQISSNNDNSGVFKDLTEVHYKGNIEWGDYDVGWDDANLKWNYFPIIGAKRRMPAGGLRCSYKQLKFTNAFSQIETSSALGTAVFNPGTFQLTLSNPAFVWPADVVDYFISYSGDNYTQQFKIEARTDTVLTLNLDSSVIPAGAISWKIYGYRRREILKLISYVIDYSLTSPSQDAFRGASA